MIQVCQRLVGRGVIDDDDFEIAVGLRKQRIERGGEMRFAIAHGQHNAGSRNTHPTEDSPSGRLQQRQDSGVELLVAHLAGMIMADDALAVNDHQRRRRRYAKVDEVGVAKRPGHPVRQGVR